MITVFNCLTTEHHLGLVGLAAVVCILISCFTVVLYAQAQSAAKKAQRYWVLAGALFMGLGAWLTHFIAMLAYKHDSLNIIGGVPTFISLVLGIGGAAIAFFAAKRLEGRWQPAIAGVTLSCSIAALHYVGISAYSVGSFITYVPSYIAASIILPVIAGVGAFVVLRRYKSVIGRAGAVALLVLMICSLHFTGMSGVTLMPKAAGEGLLLLERNNLVVSVVVAAILLVVVGGVALLYEFRQVRSKVEQTDRLIGLTEKLEVALAQAEEANKAKSNFLANLSHEIRTPMNGIIGMTRMLQDAPLPNRERDLTRIAHQSAERLLNTLNDLLDYSKLEAGKLALSSAPFNLRRLLHEVGELMAAQAHLKGIEINVVYSEDAPCWFEGDEGRLRQVLVNLAGNAVKFTDHGSVTLAAKVGVDREGPASIDLTVTDTGVGIPPHQVEKVFHRFEQADGERTRSHEGTGLGLTICSELVTLMDGEISAESELGAGSIFSVALSLPQGEPQDTDEDYGGLDLTVAPVRGSRILLVEDNLVNQMVVTKFLEVSGNAITLAKDGTEAVEQFQTGEFDVILMDLSMPVMDGFEATRLIREAEAKQNRPRTPIVAVTAHVDDSDREACFAAGMDDFVPKPIKQGLLSGVIVKWTDNMSADEADLKAAV